MKFEKNEKEFMKVFYHFYCIVIVGKRMKGDIKKWLKVKKWGFKQEFIAEMVNNNIRPINRVLDEEIKHWARLYRIHQMSDEKYQRGKSIHNPK